MSSLAIECKSVWKIFGHKPREALEFAQKHGVDKDELFRRTGCVIGVADVSFQVARGEIFCVMGLSGSGKSTMVRHINRLIEPTSGAIMIGDQDINALNKADLRRIRAEKIRHGVPAHGAAAAPHGLGQCQHGPGAAGRRSGQAASGRGREADARGSRRLGRSLPRRAVRWHEAAGGPRARHGRGPRDPAHGRAVLGARSR